MRGAWKQRVVVSRLVRITCAFSLMMQAGCNDRSSPGVDELFRSTGWVRTSIATEAADANTENLQVASTRQIKTDTARLDIRVAVPIGCELKELSEGAFVIKPPGVSYSFDLMFRPASPGHLAPDEYHESASLLFEERLFELRGPLETFVARVHPDVELSEALEGAALLARKESDYEFAFQALGSAEPITVKNEPADTILLVWQEAFRQFIGSHHQSSTRPIAWAPVGSGNALVTWRHDTWRGHARVIVEALLFRSDGSFIGSASMGVLPNAAVSDIELPFIQTVFRNMP